MAITDLSWGLMAILQKVLLGLRVEWMGERIFADSWGWEWDANSMYERLKLYVWMVISLFSGWLGIHTRVPL